LSPGGLDEARDLRRGQLLEERRELHEAADGRIRGGRPLVNAAPVVMQHAVGVDRGRHVAVELRLPLVDLVPHRDGQREVAGPRELGRELFESRHGLRDLALVVERLRGAAALLVLGVRVGARLFAGLVLDLLLQEVEKHRRG
jgi:hypothetical protein